MVDNDFNREQYSSHFQEYIDARAEKDIGGGGVESRISLLQMHLPLGSTIFEIGSGAGEDAVELNKQGYQVIASDYVAEFVQACEQKGLEAVKFDAKADVIPNNIDAIYANAVFVHFTPEETANFLKRASSNLIGPMLIFISVLKGTGSERSGRSRGFERDFQYYSEDNMVSLLHESGYESLETRIIDDKWIQVIARVR